MQWQPTNTVLVDIGYVRQPRTSPASADTLQSTRDSHSAKPINGQIHCDGYQATDADGGQGILQTEQVATTIGEFTGADGNTALRVPFIGYNPNSDFWQAEGISTNHALQISVKKRLSHGLTVNASYTWSHTLDEGSGLSEGLFFNGNDPLNPRSAYGNASFDRTHVFTINYVNQIPNPTNSEKFIKHIVNGWGVNGITTVVSALPYSGYDFSGNIASRFTARATTSSPTRCSPYPAAPPRACSCREPPA